MPGAACLVARALIGGLLAALLAGCAEPARVESIQMMALGTLFSISVVDPPPDWRPAAERAVRIRLERWERDMYPYRDGALARANAAFALGECIDPTPLLRALIDQAQALERRHGGLFNAALAQDTQRWGFDQLDGLTPPPRAAAPVAQAPASALNLHMSGARICASGPVALDFGGFAKGVIVDELLEALAALGHNDAIVNAGGDLRASGDRNGRSWRVAIRDPHGPGALAGLKIGDGESVFTSGSYERYIERDGQRHAHIFDPQTREPLTGIASVTVLGRDPGATDAAATALFVAAARAFSAADDLRRLPPVHDTPAFLIVDRHGNAWLNQPMLDRVTWAKDPPKFTILGQ